MTTPPTTDPAEQHGRQAAADLLRDAILDGRPLRRDVRIALQLLLSTLALSDRPDFGPNSPGLNESLRANQAVGWQMAAEHYRTLLAEVREHGATTGVEEQR